MLPANLAKSRAAGARGLGELVMVSPGSGMLPTLRYSPYSVPSTNTAMLALSQQPMAAAANQNPSPIMPANQGSPPPPYIDLNAVAHAQQQQGSAVSIPFADFYPATTHTSIFPAISQLQLIENQMARHHVDAAGCKTVDTFGGNGCVPALSDLVFPKNSVLYA